MLKTIIPGFYLLHSRLRANWEKASWFLIHPVVASTIAISFSGLPKERALPFLIVGFFAWLSMYEIGYLENDMAAARNGDKAGQRLTDPEVKEIRLEFRLIVVCKWLVTGMLVLALSAIAATYSTTAAVGRFACLLLAARVLFLLHNALDNRWKILTFFGLYLLKYLALALLFAVPVSLRLVSLAAMIIPLPRVMEYAAKGKFGLARWSAFVGNLDLFRLRYYAIAFGVCTLFEVFRRADAALFLFLTGYMLFVRAVAFLCATKLQIRAQA